MKISKKATIETLGNATKIYKGYFRLNSLNKLIEILENATYNKMESDFEIESRLLDKQFTTINKYTNSISINGSFLYSRDIEESYFYKFDNINIIVVVTDCNIILYYFK